MSREQAASLPPSYFDQIYEAQADPWSFETSAYEAAKYTTTLAALPHDRYQRAFEIGCSIGVLTALLARRCDRLVSVDVAEHALQRARDRCRALPWVTFERLQIPRAFPDGCFDLIVLSEVGYYWSRCELVEVRRELARRLTRGGHLILVHWTPVVADYPLTGDEVHRAFLGTEALELGLRGLYGQREECYRLDLLERR